MLLTDELLLDYKRCRRRAFLDTYGDTNKQDPEQDFLLKLREDSRAYKQEILANISYQRVNYPRRDWAAGAKATLALMQQGAECISRGVLLIQTPEVTLLSTPDLLVKQRGLSDFGDWMYVPVSIKLGKRPKPEYKILAAFQAQLLAAAQGVWPNKADLILRRPSTYSVPLATWVPLMQDVLSACMEMMLQRQEPEVFISRQKCSLCHWYSSCYAIAQTEKHISLLPGVTPSRYRDLQNLGVTTVESLAESSVSQLEPTFNREVATNLVVLAQSTVQNRAILSPQNYPWTASTNSTNGKTASYFTYNEPLPTAPIELYFDIEAEPELNVDYLFGVLVVDRLNRTETFHCLLAECPEDEALIWQQFLALVCLYPDAPIFHFSEYEVETIKRLGWLYQTPQQQLEMLVNRLVDVHERVMNTVKLPVESYSLKHLARWLGFEWRDASMTGSQTVCLYNQWLKTGDRSQLEAIRRYNEDDCRATHKVKDWLADFLRSTLK